MKFCTQCGSQLTDDAKFCTGCGTPCASVVPQITPTMQAPHKKGMAWDHLQKYGYLRKRISTGGVHVAAMQADGSVKAIGSNKSGHTAFDGQAISPLSQPRRCTFCNAFRPAHFGLIHETAEGLPPSAVIVNRDVPDAPCGIICGIHVTHHPVLAHGNGLPGHPNTPLRHPPCPPPRTVKNPENIVKM